MATYRIGLTQTVIEGTTVTVDAETPEEAERAALALARNGAVEWCFLGTASNGIEVATIDMIADRRSLEA